MKERSTLRGLSKLFGLAAVFLVAAVVFAAMPMPLAHHGALMGPGALVGIGLGQKLMMPSPIATYPFADLSSARPAAQRHVAGSQRRRDLRYADVSGGRLGATQFLHERERRPDR
jgi:hypothetical protein